MNFLKQWYGILLLPGAIAAGAFGAWLWDTGAAPEVRIPQSPEQLQERFAEVIRSAMPSVVLITAQKRVEMISPFYDFWSSGRSVEFKEVPSGQGSGFFVGENGDILTNYHVVRNQDSFFVTLNDGTELRAEVAGADPPSDLALLRISDPGNRKFPVLRFAAPESVKIGHWAIAIGAPYSLSKTVTAGIVSNKKRSGVGVNLYENYIQTDTSINPGNSGGPLLNLNGEVIGVNDFIMSPTGGNIGLSFAISSEIASGAAEALRRDGMVIRPWLGVVSQPLSREIKEKTGTEQGVLVTAVVRNSPASSFLLPGDIVQEINGKALESPGDLQSMVFEHAPGDTLTIRFLRDGRRKTATIPLEKAPRDWFRLKSRENASPAFLSE